MSENLALLYTDVVDSTLLNSSLGDEPMARQWAAHDSAARELIRIWHGREVGRSDGFLVTFPNVRDAVHFAAAYHRSLAALEPPLQARVGVHVGPVVLRENSAADTEQGATRFDIAGLALPVVARLKSLAVGRQTLLSDVALRALGRTELRSTSHGYWRIKGLSEPIEVTEIGDVHSTFLPPPNSAKAYRVARAGETWIPVGELPNNLPAERDAFIGRHESLHAIAESLDNGTRLVTLLGIGGIGKTRLALHYARGWLGDFPGGAWFCDLAASQSIDGMVHAVAQSLNVSLGKADPIQHVGAAIAGRGHCLVILDNFEQVRRFAEQTIGVWLERAPEARFIVTSREVLGIVGEQTQVLPPLDKVEAVEMFRQRVRAIGVRVRYGAEDEAAIEPLVNLLDRLPLAIELAAARARVMPPRLLLDRMGKRFELLATRGGRRDRQATLRATLDWSWDLLSAAEQLALSQLSVFEGGFTLQAAEAVIDVASIKRAPDTLTILQALVEKSLVLQRSNERFDLLIAVQEYAAERLRTAITDDLVHAQRRHGDYCAALGSHGAAAVCADIDNLVVATKRATEAGRVDAAVGNLEGAWTAFKLRGPFRAGIDLSNIVKAMPEMHVAGQARVDKVAGWALKACGHIKEAEARLSAALCGARASGDRECQGYVLTYLGDLHVDAGRMDDGRREFNAALELARSLRHRSLECEACAGLGNLFRHLGLPNEAREQYEAALSAARQAGDRRWEGGSLGNLGMICFSQGKAEEAEPYFNDALALARELGDRQWEGNTLCNLGLMHHVQGRLELAATELSTALLLARELGHARLECIVLCNLGMVVEAAQSPETARAHYESALQVARSLGDRRTEGQVLGYLGLLHCRQERFTEGRSCLDQGERLLIDVSDQMNLALLRCSRAESEFLAGALVAAEAALTAAQSWAQELGAEADSELHRSLDRVHALMATSAGLTQNKRFS